MIVSTEMELSFAACQERQHHEVSLEGLRARAAKVTPGDRARFEAGEWQPQPYPGYAVVTMVADVPENASLTADLHAIQHELRIGFGDPTALYLLPAASFHQTIANTLSDDKYQRLIVNRGLAASYPRLLSDAFADVPSVAAFQPLSMRLIGLSIFSTAIGMLGIFDLEEDFQRVLHFRDHFYRHPQISQLGIRRTRPFIGHVTIAYVERLLENDERARLAETAAAINRRLAGRDLRFRLRQAE
ncbi:MAG: hypothetical protein ACREF9_14255, partial [Opitutaceae bacterium]